MKQTFLRRTWNRYSKLGKRRKKKQVWRNPTGRHNKMREKRRGYSIVVSLGYKKNKNTKGKIFEKTPVMIQNIKDLEKMGKNEIGIIGKIGKRKRIQIAKKAKENNITLHNLNPKKYLKKNEKKDKKQEIKKEEKLKKNITIKDKK